MSNSPVVGPRALKRAFFGTLPDDLRPAGSRVRWPMPAPRSRDWSAGVILLARRMDTTIAAVVAICFHLGIPSAIPMGGAAGVNVLAIFCVLFLFVGHAEIGLSAMTNPLPLILLAPSKWRRDRRKPVPAFNLPSSPACGITTGAGTTLAARPPPRRKPFDKGVVAIANMPAAQTGEVLRQQEAAQSRSTWAMRSRGFQHPAARRCSPWRTGRWPVRTGTTIR